MSNELEPALVSAPHGVTRKRRLLFAAACGVGFATAHIASELAAWHVYFYVLGHWHATTDNLWELDRFQFSFRIEAFLAVLGGMIVLGATAIRRITSGYRPVSLLILSAGLGTLVDLIPWGLAAISKISDIFALGLILALSCLSAIAVASVAKSQSKRAAAAI